jgi:hypothetical protein
LHEHEEGGEAERRENQKDDGRPRYDVEPRGCAENTTGADVVLTGSFHGSLPSTEYHDVGRVSIGTGPQKKRGGGGAPLVQELRALERRLVVLVREKNEIPRVLLGGRISDRSK